jgi:hypothetical protein
MKRQLLRRFPRLDLACDVHRGPIGQFRGEGLGYPHGLIGSLLDRAHAQVTCDDIQPVWKAAFAPVFVHIAKRSRQNLLGQVGGGFAVAGKSVAPAGDSRLVPRNNSAAASSRARTPRSHDK